MRSQHKTGNRNFPSYLNRNCIQNILFTKNTSNARYAPRLSWWHCSRDNLQAHILANCTRTTGAGIERVINHITDESFPPWSEKVQPCAVSITFLYPAISISESAGGVIESKLPDTSAVLSQFISWAAVLICSISGAVTWRYHSLG